MFTGLVIFAILVIVFIIIRSLQRYPSTIAPARPSAPRREVSAPQRRARRTAKTDRARVEQQGLPVLESTADLAAALGLTAKQLNWFLFDRIEIDPRAGVSKHYVLTRIRKSGGGERILLAPKTQLKAAQRWILRHILDVIPPHDAAQGFRRGRSVRSNAAPHAGHEAVACFDLQDFFPTITYPRVRGLFLSLGYGWEVAAALAALCTTRMPGRRQRVLPQGAPTSPAISNLIVRRFDLRLAGLAAALGYTYTRYADDCTMSGSPSRLGALIRTVRAITRGEGFVLHDRKLRIHRRGARQQVTGIVVNAAPTLPRAERRRLRAILHQAQYSGLAAQNRAGHAHFTEYLRGKIAFLHMINPRHAQPLSQAFHRLLAQPAGVTETAGEPAAPAPGIAGYTPGPETLKPK